jgi:hypothetical protein
VSLLAASTSLVSDVTTCIACILGGILHHKHLSCLLYTTHQYLQGFAATSDLHGTVHTHSTAWHFRCPCSWLAVHSQGCNSSQGATYRPQLLCMRMVHGFLCAVWLCSQQLLQIWVTDSHSVSQVSALDARVLGRVPWSCIRVSYNDSPADCPPMSLSECLSQSQNPPVRYLNKP